MTEMKRSGIEVGFAFADNAKEAENAKMTEMKRSGISCTAPLIFRQTALPDFPSDYVGFNRRCNRIASLSRLADEKSFCGVLPEINDAVH